jgi:hypothetical protein
MESQQLCSERRRAVGPVAPRPLPVPREIVEDRGLHRGGGRKRIRPSREPRQRGNGRNLDDKPDRAHDSECAEAPHQATFESTTAGSGSAA